MASDIPVSCREQWAQYLVRKTLLAELTAIQGTDEDGCVTYDGKTMPLQDENKPIGWDNLPRDTFFDGDESKRRPPPTYPDRKVCIVGAGVAGLYIAMILDDLHIPNLTYDIFEANDRVGGRVFTHHFSQEKNDFYEVGAMRFPNIPKMRRTFDLFKRTNVPTIEYFLAGKNCPSLYNDRFLDEGPDPYHVSKSNKGSVPDDVVDSVGEILENTFGPYKDALDEDPVKGFDKLMSVDDFSTREYLKRGGPKGDEPRYNFFAIQWMETQNTGSNLFDLAFSESVFESMEFSDPDIKWVCIDGGSSVLTDQMQKIIKTKVTTKARVSKISMDKVMLRPTDNNMSVTVEIDSEAEPRTACGYCTVFATTTLPCLRRMDLRTLNLLPEQKDAIRCLHYDDSAKVGLKFSEPWWINDCNITQGGSASTDLPLRTCVYPSYNLNDGKDKPAVLLASYTWSQDATRVGSLVQREDQLKDLLLRDLARLHANFPKEGRKRITYERLKELCIDFHPWSWSHDSHMGGAFAMFGPGQFSNFYPFLVRPAADNKFHMVGEASSVNHGWIAGALDSAYAAVRKFLERYRKDYWKFIRDLEKRWGTVPECEAGNNGTVHLENFLCTLSK